MTPKGGMAQAQKLEKILQFFHESRTCHTLKDLETTIPAATKVNKMQVKDLLKELTDTNQVKVEKIGSGNWYWAWAGEEAAERRKEIERLETEEVALQASITSLETRNAQLKAEQAESRADPRFHELLEQLPPLEQEVAILTKEKDELESAVAGGFEAKQQELEKLKSEVGQMTDNIYAMESWLLRWFQGDRSILESVRQVCYGEDYVEGEGLEDIDGI